MQARMPTLFVAHGSPMNAIDQNDFTRALGELGQRLIKPKAVLVISAHWRTSGTRVLNVANPKTIHDFSGFPRPLYDVQYRAPGNPEIAERITRLLAHHGAKNDDSWGLDHGTWSVLRHIYPEADVPVVQLSLNTKLDLAGHYAVANDLAVLRDEGVLILGSGNITHNLAEVDFDTNATPLAWAEEFDQKIALVLQNRDLEKLINFSDQATAKLWRRALPTLEHYMPLIYALGASNSADPISFPYVGIQNATLSMRCVQFGLLDG